jgi:hypothetical protein
MARYQYSDDRIDGVLSILASAFDLTERKHAEAEVQLLAVTDPLTGLGNYRRLVRNESMQKPRLALRKG